MPSFAVETSSRVYYFHPSTKDPEVAQQECDKWLAALTETQERMRVDLLNEKFIAAGGSPGEVLYPSTPLCFLPTPEEQLLLPSEDGTMLLLTCRWWREASVCVCL